MHKSLAAMAACIVMAGFSATAHAHAGHHRSPNLPDAAKVAAPVGVTVQQCWIRALPNRLPAAAYFRVENTSKQDQVLVGAQADGFGKVMLHSHQDAGGMARMVHVDQVVVPAEGGFDFEPRGHHVMLEQAEFDLEIGSQRDITLWFEGPAALSVSCDVRPPGTLQ